MARFRRIPLEELQRLSYPDVARYLAELNREFAKKQPRLYKRLYVEKIKAEDGYTRSPNEISGLLQLIKLRIRDGDRMTRGLEESYEQVLDVATYGFRSYVKAVIWERINDYTSSILKLGRRTDKYAIEWALENWSDRNWNDFFKSRYFQQVYIEYGFGSSPELVEFSALDENGLSPWTRRMVDWAKKRGIDFNEWVLEKGKRVRQRPLKKEK